VREEKPIYFVVDNNISLRGLRSISSMGRRARRLFSDLKRMPTTKVKVPFALVSLSIILFSAFVIGGGIYDLLDNPPVIVPGPRGWIAVYPVMQEQTLNESILSMFFTLLIFSGMFSAYRSSQIAYDSKRATTMLVIGITLILLGLLGSHYILILKRMAIRGS
jgi:hypothetical protein